MKFEKFRNGWVFWNDKIMIPIVREDDTRSWFIKEIPFEEAKNYWEYVLEGDTWNIYYVKRGTNRRLAQHNVGKFSPFSIAYRLSDKDISTMDCKKLEEATPRFFGRDKFQAGVYWSKDYDGRSVFELMAAKPKMPYEDIKMVVEGEGGSIDSQGIIHRGN